MPKNQLIPTDYKSFLDLRETERAIKLVKDFFERGLAEKLNLQREIKSSKSFCSAFCEKRHWCE